MMPPVSVFSSLIWQGSLGEADRSDLSFQLLLQASEIPSLKDDQERIL